ncbi:MAG: Hsp20/alpha crystallin family protein [Candidatus Nanohaloarchaea archaeon]|nr:Hsp20/alpha crystallin family protein [Candidatus Nanohaloarchaea archaeon]
MADPFREMRKRMNRMFEEFSNEFGTEANGLKTSRLPIDMKETEDNVIVTADIPGVEKENIKVRVRDGNLNVSAESRQEKREQGDNYIRKERSSISYSRRIPLPSYVDEESAEASYENGVLKIELNKKKEKKKKGKKVEVK